MKQKYTLNIADMELNVLTEVAPETVEQIAGLLDRKMREIFLQSRCVTRNEAAIRCAMEFCFEWLNNQNKISELDALTAKYNEVLHLIKQQNDELTAEIEKVESENKLLRSLITTKKEEEEAAGQSENAVSPAEFLEQVALAQTTPAEEHVKGRPGRKRRAKTEEAEEAPADAGLTAEEAAKPRSKVGSMFDTLSFDEV